MRVLLDFDVLTFDDYIDFEELTDSSITDAVASMVKQKATVAQQRGLVWVFSRHVDPTFSLADAGSLRPGDVEWEVPGSPAPDGED